MVDAARQFMTPDEFLAWHEQQDERYELIDGVPVLKFDNGPEMMAGASERHDAIVVNLIQALRQLRGGPCRVKTADQATRTARGNLRMPDVTIDCGPHRPLSYVSVEPTVLFEVLSPSTRRMDLLRKTEEYRALPTLRHFVLLEPDQPYALLWSREGSGEWRQEAVEGLQGALALTAVGATLAMTDVYEDVDFEG